MSILTNIFLSILNISIMGTIAAAFLLLVKWIFRNGLNQTWHYYIWIILVIRLIIPVFPESPFSLFNLAEMFQQELNEKGIAADNLMIKDILPDDSMITEHMETPLPDNKTALDLEVNNNAFKGFDADFKPSNTDVNDSIDANPYNFHGNISRYTGTAQITRSNNAVRPLSIIWILGVIGFLTYKCICNIHINRRIKKCPVLTYTANTRILNILNACKTHLSINSTLTPLICDGFGSPCLYGLIKPKLLIPGTLTENVDERHIRYIFLHELIHLKRKDLYLNAVLFVLKAVYWFNPLFWYCFSAMHSDCEISCDVSVMLRLESKERIEYGKTILEVSGYCSGLKPSCFVAEVTNKKSDTKKRIIKVISFRKPSFLVTSLTVVITLILGFVLLTDGIVHTRQQTITEHKTGITENGSNGDVTEMNETITAESESDAAEKLSNTFEKICFHASAGYSQEIIKQEFPDEYNYIITTGERAVDFLKTQIHNITGKLNHSPGKDSDNKEPSLVRQDMLRRKITAEWLISDIFKKRGGEKYKPYEHEYPVTVLKRDCIGRTGPSDGLNSGAQSLKIQ